MKFLGYDGQLPYGYCRRPQGSMEPKEEPFKSVDVAVVTVMTKYCTLWNRGESLEESYSNSEYSIQDMLDMLKIYVEKDVDNKNRSAILSSIDGWYTETVTIE